MKQIIGFLRLTRPANIVTAVADILAGVAISGYLTGFAQGATPIIWLSLATMGLYGGGVVLNDVFDAELDAVERPERPIPSGVVSRFMAAMLGMVLLGIGILAAGKVNWMPSGMIAAAIALFSVVYDKWGKHQLVLGPINMGLCRGLNLVLGMSIVPGILDTYWWLGIVPVIYIAAITMISRGEVHGGSKLTLYIALALYVVVIGAILWFSTQNNAFYLTLAFVLAFGGMIAFPLFKAISDPIGKNIGKAVKSGVIALILMNAAWSSAFGVTYFALGIVLLLPLSLLLAKAFAVT
ncbi:UbiA-like protein EboC [uncultured Imperialibacter sp.]|uniref:UbiA-like protein EboC n=1 Tax=uncultured Imperialibacter sp. TaxID=1672639 RepID=UPI0030DD74F0